MMIWIAFGGVLIGLIAWAVIYGRVDEKRKRAELDAAMAKEYDLISKQPHRVRPFGAMRPKDK